MKELQDYNPLLISHMELVLEQSESDIILTQIDGIPFCYDSGSCETRARLIAQYLEFRPELCEKVKKLLSLYDL